MNFLVKNVVFLLKLKNHYETYEILFQNLQRLFRMFLRGNTTLEN